MKWRYLANSYAYMVSIPTNPLAAKIAFAFQQTPVKWRGSFYFMTGVSPSGVSSIDVANTASGQRSECTMLVFVLPPSDLQDAAPQESRRRFAYAF